MFGSEALLALPHGFVIATIHPMKDDTSGSPTFKESCWAALVTGLLLFAKDWSGYSRNPAPFYPRSLRDIWWHLPLMVGAVFIVIQLARLLDWVKKKRSFFFWIGYSVLLVLVVVAVGLALVVLIP